MKHAILQHAQRFWQRRSSRERMALSIAAAVLALGIAWGLIWEPAQLARAKLGKRNATLTSQLAQMQGMQQEAVALRARPPTLAPPEQMAARILAAFAAQGLNPRVDVDVPARLARVQVEGTFEACLAAADTLRKDSHWSLSQVRFEAGAKPGVVRAQMGWSAQ